MNNNKKEKGFTIVELMVGIIITSVLVLTIGSMLFYTYVSWFKNCDAVELQRDATIAMDMIARSIRPRTILQISASGPILTAGSEKFEVSGSDLRYYPDTVANPGDYIEIVKGKITTPSPFTKVGASRFVRVNMVLEDNTESITVQSIINYRTQI